jgi:phage shock protein PspC (stress-responsive transcriptional regulator)
MTALIIVIGIFGAVIILAAYIICVLMVAHKRADVQGQQMTRVYKEERDG